MAIAEINRPDLLYVNQGARVKTVAERSLGDKHLSPEVQVRCCEASEKWMHAQRGDILIDDSVKHRKRWVKAGGIWVTHRSAEGTVAILDIMGL